MKNLLLNHIWIVTIGVFAVVSIIFAMIVGMWVNFLTSLLITILIFSFLLGVLLVQGVVSVPERYNYILTYFGSYNKKLKPGLNIVYPWFGIFNIPIAFNVSEHSIDVFKDAEKDYTKMVEFKESAAWIKLSARVKVLDPKKAFTNVEDVYEEIREIFKKYFRDYAEDKSILDFKDKNGNIDLDTLFGFSPILDYIENNWGVQIISTRLEDVILSELDRKARQEVYAEKNKLEVVDLQNKQTVSKARAKAKEIKMIAEAEKTAQELEGTGLKVALKKITESNLSPEEASRFLQSMKKWEAVPKVQTGFFSDSNQSSTESGMSKQVMAEIIAMSNEIGKKQ